MRCACQHPQTHTQAAAESGAMSPCSQYSRQCTCLVPPSVNPSTVPPSVNPSTGSESQGQELQGADPRRVCLC
eukprot:351454-Chlamydomonas_euryale.AAC.3